MIHELVKIERTLKSDPSTPAKEWAKSITKQQKDMLIRKGYITKIGDKKGTLWYWDGVPPDYAMVDELRFVPEVKEKIEIDSTTTLLDVFKKREIKLKINGGMSVLFKGDSVLIQKSNGKTIKIDTAEELNDILDFIL